MSGEHRLWVNWLVTSPTLKQSPPRIAKAAKVVDDNSAILGISNERTIPMDANHNDTCKFRNSTHELFTPVVTQIKSSVDRVVLHTPGGQEGFSKSVFEIPNTRNLKFSGREVELALLEERLASPTLNIPYSYPVVAIYGLGGVGYVSICVEFNPSRVINCHRIGRPSLLPNTYTDMRGKDLSILPFGSPQLVMNPLILT